MRLDIKCNNKIRNEAEKLAFISGIGKDKTSSKTQEVFQCLLVNILDRLYKTGDCSGTLLLHPKYYSKSPIVNGRSIPERKVSYHYIRKAINWLEANEFITVKVGGLLQYDDYEDTFEIYKRETSKYEVTEKFLNYFQEVIKSYYPLPETNVVKLRNSKKEDIVFKIKDDIKIKKTLLQDFNNIFNGVKVLYNTRIFHIQLNKIFNLSFDRGGRSYMLNGSFQTLSKEERSASVLDYGDGIEHKLCELDFRALHPSILYTKEGIILEDDFDPYGVINLHNFNKEQYRNLCKMALLILINASNYEAAIGALKYRLILDKLPKEGESPDYPDIHDKLNGSDNDYEELAKIIIKAIKDKNSGISKYFHSGEGTKLMCIEADIMDNIIEHFLDKHIIVLPIHDSAAIQEDYCDELLEVMQDSYEKVLGTTSNCRIERKY